MRSCLFRVYFLIAFPDSDAGARIDVFQVLHHLILVRADDHLTVGTDEERVTDATEVHRVDDLHQGFQTQVAADHAEQLAVLFHRHGDGHHQPADGGHVRRGQHGLVGNHGLFVPGTLTRIVTVRHLRVRALGEYTVGLARRR